MAALVNNTFQVNGASGTNSLTIDTDGNTVINKLVLLDEKTGNKWQIKISDGELVVEPLELEDKREFKLKKLLNDIKTKKIFVETETAEMTKHAINSFLACSITFINEIASIAKKYSISFDDLKKCIQSDKRIGYKSYLKPGNAFSGGTLGRDINFLLKESKKNKTNSILLKSILISNRKHSKWVENLINKKFPSNKNCILQIGLSYTHGTSTLRRSLPYEIFNKLSKSYYIKVYDNYIKSNLDAKSALKSFFLEPKSNNKFNIILAFNKIDKKFLINSFIKKNATIIDVNGENKDNTLLKKIKYISLENG